MKSAAKFDREEKCTKVHLFNAFRRAGAYPPVPVVTAKAIIGDNAPKYLLRKGYVQEYSRNQTDYYEMTPEGIAWLEKGLRRHLELHPDDAANLQHPLPGTRPSGTPRLIRRAR